MRVYGVIIGIRLSGVYRDFGGLIWGLYGDYTGILLGVLRDYEGPVHG